MERGGEWRRYNISPYYIYLHIMKDGRVRRSENKEERFTIYYNVLLSPTF